MSEERKPVVLFLCTGNSARSQMAEALLRRLDANSRFDVHSAGLNPRPEVHPLTLRVLEEVGIDTSSLHPKDTSNYLGRVSVRYAVIVCSKAQEQCPRIYPFATRTLYWPFDDPAACEGTEFERLEKFREVRDEIDQRLQRWLKMELED